MKDSYPIVITPAGTDYVVYVPDFDINTEGYSIADAMAMARDAIALVGITLEDSGQSIPSSSALSCVHSESNDIRTLVDVDFDDYRRKNDQRVVKKNCTIPSWLCYAAEKENINFSQVLQEGLKARLGLA